VGVVVWSGPLRPQPGEFGAPPRPGGPFAGVQLGSLPVAAGGVLLVGDPVELGRVAAPPVALLGHDQPGGRQPVQDVPGGGVTPAEVSAGVAGGAGPVEVGVQAAQSDAEPAASSERVVAAERDPIGELTLRDAPQGGADLCGARDRL